LGNGAKLGASEGALPRELHPIDHCHALGHDSLNHIKPGTTPDSSAGGLRLAGLYKNLGVTYINWGRPADALEPLQHALKVQPYCGQTHFHLGVANNGLGRHQEAIKNYEEAIRHRWTDAALLAISLVLLRRR